MEALLFKGSSAQPLACPQTQVMRGEQGLVVQFNQACTGRCKTLSASLHHLPVAAFTVIPLSSPSQCLLQMCLRRPAAPLGAGLNAVSSLISPQGRKEGRKVQSCLHTWSAWTPRLPVLRLSSPSWGQGWLLPHTVMPRSKTSHLQSLTRTSQCYDL